jgi:hypothetical protein
MMLFFATIDADSDTPTLHEHMPPVAVMLPASSWYRVNFRRPRLPEQIREVAADCGGFVAARRWRCYRYTLAQYVAWLEAFHPQWAAMLDYCCEPPLAGDPHVVRRRQLQTTFRAWQIWQHYPDAPWVWVPTIQGWEVEEYVLHAHELRPLIDEMQAYYGATRAFRVGIGTLCARASTATIRSVVGAVAHELPGVGLHLWGVKLSTFKAPIALHEQVISFDSAAWNGLFGSDREEWRSSGLSQRAWSYSVALPRYTLKIGQALRQPKQVSFFDG